MCTGIWLVSLDCCDTMYYLLRCRRPPVGTAKDRYPEGHDDSMAFELPVDIQRHLAQKVGRSKSWKKRRREHKRAQHKHLAEKRKMRFNPHVADEEAPLAPPLPPPVEGAAYSEAADDDPESGHTAPAAVRKENQAAEATTRNRGRGHAWWPPWRTRQEACDERVEVLEEAARRRQAVSRGEDPRFADGYYLGHRVEGSSRSNEYHGGRRSSEFTLAPRGRQS